MDPTRFLAEQFGFFTRRDAEECGYADRDIAAMVRSKIWVRFRRGFYTYADLCDRLDDVGRHRVRSHAVLRSLGHQVALSHVSAVVDHGIDTWGMDLSRVHVTRLDGASGRIEGDVVHHAGVCLDGDVLERHGHLLVVADRSIVEAASIATDEAALVGFDAFLRLVPDSGPMLMNRFTSMERWPRTRHLHIPIRLADGGSQSVGESRGRWFCWIHRLPVPQTQFEVRDSEGILRGTCDWWWPKPRVLGEFDGRVKYGRLLKPGQDPGEVVFAEKQREDELREISGCRMIRLIWSDYDRPRVTAGRLARALGVAA
jgi:hypothetical protein